MCKEVAEHLVKITCTSCRGCNSILKVPPINVDVYGKPIAIITDNVLTKNVVPFTSICATKKSPIKACTPVIAGIWKNPENHKTFAYGQKVLTGASELICSNGGVIKIDLPEPSSEADALNPIDKLKKKINGAYEKVVNKIKSAGEAISDGLTDAIKDITDPLKDLMDNPTWQNMVAEGKATLAQIQAAKDVVDIKIQEAEDAYTGAVKDAKKGMDREIGGREDRLLNDIEAEFKDIVTEVENGINDGLDALNNYLDNKVDVEAIVEKVLSDETLSSRTGWTNSQIADYVRSTYQEISTVYKDEIEAIKDTYNAYEDGDSEAARVEFVQNMLDLFDNGFANGTNVPIPTGTSPLTPDEIRAIVSQKIEAGIDDGFEEVKEEVSEAADDYRKEIEEKKKEIKDKYSLNNYLQDELDEILAEIGIQEEIDRVQADSAEIQKDLDTAAAILNAASDYDALVAGIIGGIVAGINSEYSEEIAEITAFAVEAQAEMKKLNSALSMASSVYNGIKFLASGLPVGLVLVCGSAASANGNGGSGDGSGSGGGGGAGGGSGDGDGSGTGNEDSNQDKKAVIFLIGGAADKDDFYVMSTTNNLRDNVVRPFMSALAAKGIDEHCQVEYIRYKDVRGKELPDIISRIPNKENTGIYIIGHSLGGWNGAHLSKILTNKGYNVEGLVTLDPVGTGLVRFISDIYKTTPRPKAKYWINICTKPKLTDYWGSDIIADLGGQWRPSGGMQVNAICHCNHKDSDEMFFDSHKLVGSTKRITISTLILERIGNFVPKPELV